MSMNSLNLMDLELLEELLDKILYIFIIYFCLRLFGF